MSDPARPDVEERRSRLLGIKLRTLVADHLGRDDAPATASFPDGAAMLLDGDAWVLIDGDASRALGRAMAWAVRHHAGALHLVAGTATGLLARRASRFRFPVEVWFAEGRTLLPAPAVPLTAPPAPDPAHLALAELIERAGATANVEHGVVFGEVRGLEVCRVVDTPTVGHIAEAPVGAVAPNEAHDGGGALLEVGVGDNDREAFQLLHGDLPTVEALSGVVAAVARHRSAESPQHPLNRLAAERLLRWRAEQTPASIGLAALVPAQPPVPRPNLKDPVPCVAAGTDTAGRPHTVVFSTGVDLDLAPYLADVDAMVADRGDDAALVAVTRSRDRVALTRELVGLLTAPVELRTFD